MVAFVRSLTPWAAMIVVLAGLLLVARDQIVLMAVAVVVALLVLLIAFFGLERSGRYLVVGGFFAAPMSAVVMPGASFATATDLLFALGFGLLLPTIIASRSSLRLPVLYSVGALGSLMMGTVASISAPDILASFDPFGRYIAGVLIVPLAFMVWKPPVRIIGHLAMAYTLGVCASVMWGVVKNGERPGARFIGLTEHPNVLGITGLLGLALIPFIWSRVADKHRWLWLGVAGINAAVVWFSGSRAALVVAVAVVLTWPVIERSVRGGAWLILAGAVGVLVADQLLASSSSDSAIARLLGGGSAVASDAQRSALTEHYWAEFMARPITGSGFEEAILGHDVYLEVAYAMGIFGFASFMLILIAGSLPLFTTARPLHRIAYPVIAYAMIAPLTSVIWDRYIWAPIALSFAIAMRDRTRDPDEASLEANLLAPDPAHGDVAAEFTSSRRSAH